MHTLGWPLRKSSKYGEFGGSFIYPMGDDMVSLGFVAGLEYRDVEFSVHDVLQEFKTHRLVSKILRDGERIAWGAKTITEGGFHALPKRFHAPGLLLAGESAGLVNVPTLKGIHYAIESGILAAEAAFRSLQRGESPNRVGALDSYDEELRASYVLKDLHEVPQHAAGLRQGLLHGRRARERDDRDQGEPAAEGVHDRAERRPDADPHRPRSRYPAPDGKLTFDKLSSVFLSGNRTRDDQPNHIRIQRTVPKDLADAWVHMCPAQVYEAGAADGDGPGARRGEPVELRPVRSDHRQGRPPDSARGRQRARVHAHLERALQASAIAIRCSTDGWLSKSRYDHVGGSGSLSDWIVNCLKRLSAAVGSCVVSSAFQSASCLHVA